PPHAPHTLPLHDALPICLGRMTATPAHCPYCALQCGMTLRTTEADGTRADGTRADGPVPGSTALRVEPRDDVPANLGGLCQKGWTAAELLTVPDRLTVPLMRRGRDAALEPCTWGEALGRGAAGAARRRGADGAGRVAAEAARLRARYGPDAVAVFGGGGLTNEKAYQLGRFARVALGTSQIDYNGRFCMSSAAAASARAFGLDRGLPGPVTDLAAS